MLAKRLPDALIANSDAVGAAWTGTDHTLQSRTTVVRTGVNLDRFTAVRRERYAEASAFEE